MFRILGVSWGCVFLFLLAVSLSTASNSTCELPTIDFEEGMKRHYVVGVLAIRGPEAAFNEWNKTFNAYLTQTAGKRFTERISFSMVALNFITLFTSVETKEVDFIFVNPSAYSCMESQYGANSLASLRNIRRVGSNEYTTTEFGGVVFTRKDRKDLNKLSDLKDRSFAAASISGLGSGQAQFRLLGLNDINFLFDAAQAVFTSNQGKVVQMVETRKVDFGFVRTDQIEGMESKGATNLSYFKFIEADYKMSGNELFPFPLSTRLYPEWNVGSLPQVHWKVQQQVQYALFDISGDHEAALAGKYLGWRPTLSYMTLRDMQEELGVILRDPADKIMKCVRSTTLYDAIICPSGYYKKSEEEVLSGCTDAGRECPEGMQCICRPCEKGFEVEVLHVRDGTVVSPACSKMQICGQTRQRTPIKFKIVDRKERAKGQLSYVLHADTLIKGEGNSVQKNFTYEMEIPVDSTGVHVMEIFLNGEQISESPLLLEVLDRDCVSEYGAELREPDPLGECVCRRDAVMVSGKCVEIPEDEDPWVLLLSIFLPLAVIVALCAWLYMKFRRQQSESYWRVKFTDLNVSDPVEVLGRGTFGMVLKAEYRGTIVAIKRVLPSKKKAGGGGGLFGSISGSTAMGSGALPGGTNLSSDMVLSNGNTIEGGTDTHGRVSSEETVVSVHEPPGLLPVNSNDSGARRLDSNEKSAPSVNFELPEDEVVVSDDLELEKDERPNWASSSQYGDSMRSLRSGTGDQPFTGGSMLQRESVSIFSCPCLTSETSKLHTEFLEEMAIISKLRHPCITTVMGAVVERGREPLLILELMDHGSLHDLLRNDTLDIDGDIILPVIRDIVQGMNFLHKADPPIIHGDVKSQNVLVDFRFRAKVADFGLTQKKKVGMHGTLFFMAPELFKGEPVSPVSDVYAFAVLLCEVYSRKDPYEGEDPREVLLAIQDLERNPPKRCEIPPHMPPEFVVMLKECWHADKTVRPRFHEIDRRLKTFEPSTAHPLNTVHSQDKRKQNNMSDLLYDVFPKHIADALSEGRKIEPEHKDVVTIFFSDIVGFTNISSTVAPEKVSNMLDRLYTTFDDLSRQHGVFKVETIGDAYMAVTNLVEDQHADHAIRIAKFSLAAIAAAQETLIDADDPDRGHVNIRVGFHSGPVVANVVGTRNPRYCLFGDTVNTASRMESNSIENRIHMSQAAARCVRQQDKTFVISSRGAIEVKGKGQMKTYWLLGDNITNVKRSGSCESAGNGSSGSGSRRVSRAPSGAAIGFDRTSSLDATPSAASQAAFSSMVELAVPDTVTEDDGEDIQPVESG